MKRISKKTLEQKAKEPNGYTVELAGSLYQMWHEKTPNDIFEERLDFPPKCYAVGEATHILYESDKWQEDGDTYRYLHKFDSRPTLYDTEGVMLPEDLLPYDEKNTNVLMGVESMDEGSYGFPMLARVLALTYVDADGVRRKIRFKSYKPVMSCSINQQTLVIFAEEILIIHGGTMVVDAPGIID